MTSRTTLKNWTVENLGQSATDADLEQFRGWVERLMERDGLSEEDATAALWGDGDYASNAARLGLIMARMIDREAYEERGLVQMVSDPINWHAEREAVTDEGGSVQHVGDLVGWSPYTTLYRAIMDTVTAYYAVAE